MLINVVEEQEVRIAFLEDDELKQLYLERTERERIVGNIHKGIVVNLVPNIEAAFVEFGYSKHGFLHISDILPSAVGRKERSDDIRKLLREGSEALVQVTKEGIGDKGPSLTTYLSLPGRYLVLMPGLTRRGVSRRIVDEQERNRLREIVQKLEVPEKMGLIARTAGEGRSEKDLAHDLEYLLRLWHAISQRAERSKSPAMVYQESDPVTRVIRDVFSEDIRRIIVDSQEVYDKVNNIAPDLIVLFGNLNWRSVGTVGNPDIYTFENDTGPDDANHARCGMYLLHHPSLSAKGRVDTATLYDVAPTVLRMLDLPVPGDMRGNSLV